VVCDAVHGTPLGVFQENRYLTDLRTGAAGAIAVKHCASPKHKKVEIFPKNTVEAFVWRIF